MSNQVDFALESVVPLKNFFESRNRNLINRTLLIADLLRTNRAARLVVSDVGITVGVR